MRRSLFYLVLIPNLGFGQFVNLGFEQWDAKSQSFASWFGLEGTVIQVNQQAYQGEKALSLQSKPEANSAYFLQVQNLTLGVPRRLTLSGRVNAENLNGKAGIYATVRGPNGRTYYNQVFAKEEESWVRIKIEILIDDQSNQVFIGGIIMGQGHALFDQFEISEKRLVKQSVNKASQFIDELGVVISENSLVANEIDLDGLLSLGKYFVSADSSVEAAHAVADFLINKLEDGHSRLMRAEDYRNWKFQLSSTAWVQGEMIDDMAYIEIPGFRSGNNKQVTTYVNKLRALINDLANKEPQGWIIDLRKNTGGNAFAMIAGLSSFYSMETVAWMTYPDQSQKPISLKKKSVWFDGKVQAKGGRNVKYKIDQPKVAVLIGTESASAGELLAITLKSLSNVKVFGQQTAGYTTNRELFALSNGSALFLVTSYYSDVFGKTYQKGLEPEVYIDGIDADDEVMNVVRNWILEN